MRRGVVLAFIVLFLRSFSSEECQKAAKQTPGRDNATMDGNLISKKRDGFKFFNKSDREVGHPKPSDRRLNLSSSRITTRNYRHKNDLLDQVLIDYTEKEILLSHQKKKNFGVFKRTLTGLEVTRKYKSKPNNHQRETTKMSRTLTQSKPTIISYVQSNKNSVLNPNFIEFVADSEVNRGKSVKQRNHLDKQAIQSAYHSLKDSSQALKNNTSVDTKITRKSKKHYHGSRDYSGSTKKKFVTVMKELKKTVSLFKKLDIPKSHKNNTNSMQKQPKRRKDKALKRKSISVPGEIRAHFQKYQTADLKVHSNVSPHQMLLNYFKAENELRQNGGQDKNGQDSQLLTKSRTSTRLLKTEKPSLVLDHAIATLKQHLLPRKQRNSTKVTKNYDSFKENSFENKNDTKKYTCDNKTDVRTVLNNTGKMNSNYINNNNKSAKINLTKTVFQKGYVFTPPNGTLEKQEHFPSSVDITINMLQKIMQQKFYSELLPQNSSLFSASNVNLNYNNTAKTTLEKEENAEMRTMEHLANDTFFSSEEIRKKMLGRFEQIENNISTNVLESWIYHYKSLDGLGLTNSMLNSGFTHNGSTKRLKRAFEKALGGKDVNLLIVGGSISAGGGIWKDRGNIDGLYERAVLHWWDKVIYPLTDSRLIVNEVTIGGTDSEYFSYCVKNYINVMPDIVLWEMAANDYQRYQNRSFDPAAPLETLSRILLLLPSNPALIYIDFFRGDYYKTSVGNNCPNSEDEGQQLISDYYNITSLSWRTMICSNIGAKKGIVPFTLGTLFSSDGYHPSLLGHAQMAYLLITYMRKVMQGVLFNVKTSISSGALFPQVEADMKSSDIPEPIYTDQFTPDPRCWTLLTPNYNLPTANTLPNLLFTQAERFELTNITQWSVRLDRLRCLRALEPGAFLVLTFSVPLQPGYDPGLVNNTLAGRDIAITTHNHFGGSAELWLDQNYTEKVVVAEPKTGQRRTQVNVLKRHIKAGMHTLTVKAIESGFCLSAVMLK